MGAVVGGAQHHADTRQVQAWAHQSTYAGLRF